MSVGFGYMGTDLDPAKHRVPRSYCKLAEKTRNAKKNDDELGFMVTDLEPASILYQFLLQTCRKGKKKQRKRR
jgi:hypothetical protein